MRVELVDGKTNILNVLLSDKWRILNTFPNPHPEPYFFALVELNDPQENEYDIESVKEFVYGSDPVYPRWERTKNEARRKKDYEEYKKTMNL
jgi:uncharacterized OB-fold protein